MTSVRWGRLVGGGLLLGSLMLVPALIPSTDERMLTGAILDAGHVLLFGACALALLWLLQRTIPLQGRARWLHYAVALAGVAAIGLATEFAQIFVRRDADLVDFGRDLLGGGAALFFHLAMARSGPVAGGIARLGAGLMAVACLVAGFYGLVAISGDYAARNGSFPSICGFEDPWERRFVRALDGRLTGGAAPEGWAGRSTAGRLDLDPAEYPGLLIREPVEDWTPYQALRFGIWSELGEPLVLVVRVHDVHHDQTLHDRFNREIHVRPGANEFSIPLAEIAAGPTERELDLARVAGIAIFAVNPPGSLTLWFDRIELTGGVDPAQPPSP